MWEDIPADLGCTPTGDPVALGDPCADDGLPGEQLHLRCDGRKWTRFYAEDHAKPDPYEGRPCTPGERLPRGYECYDPENPPPLSP